MYNAHFDNVEWSIIAHIFEPSMYTIFIKHSLLQYILQWSTWTSYYKLMQEIKE